MGVKRIDYSTCTDCTICVKVCPTDVFRMDPQSGHPMIQYAEDCMSCFLCERDCPEGSIYVTPDRETRVPMAWSDLSSKRVDKLQESGTGRKFWKLQSWGE
ncbi:MAG: ferredoxin family protein [Dehalococcoidia bacterium]